MRPAHLRPEMPFLTPPSLASPRALESFSSPVRERAASLPQLPQNSFPPERFCSFLQPSFLHLIHFIQEALTEGLSMCPTLGPGLRNHRDESKACA